MFVTRLASPCSLWSVWHSIAGTKMIFIIHHGGMLHNDRPQCSRYVACMHSGSNSLRKNIIESSMVARHCFRVVKLFYPA